MRWSDTTQPAPPWSRVLDRENAMHGSDRFSARGPVAVLLVIGILGIALFSWEVVAQRERRDERQEEKASRQEAKIARLAAEADPQTEPEAPHDPFGALIDGISARLAPASHESAEPAPPKQEPPSRETAEEHADSTPPAD